MCGANIAQARSLRYLDVSETNWDRKGVEYLVQALNTPRQPPNLPPETPSKAQKLLGLRDRSRSEPPNLTSDVTPFSSDDSDAEDEAASILTSEADTISVYGSFIPPAPLLKSSEEDVPASLQTLRMDGCVFRSNVLEALGLCLHHMSVCADAVQPRAFARLTFETSPYGVTRLALLVLSLSP